MVWKMLQDSTTITYVSVTFGISRSTILSFKKRVKQQGSMKKKNIPDRSGNLPWHSEIFGNIKGLLRPTEESFEGYYRPI